MNLTICNNPRKFAFLVLLCGAATSGMFAKTAIAQPQPFWTDGAIELTKRVVMALPYSVQKRTAKTMNSIPYLKEEGTKWRLRILVKDFLDTTNETPLDYYINEFIAIINDNVEYFKTLLFEHAFKANTPNKDEVVQQVLDRLHKVKHSKNIGYIKAMLYLPFRKLIRRDTAIPTDKKADAALAYHAKFNKG